MSSAPRSGGIDRGIVLLIVIVGVLAGTGVIVALSVRTDEISDIAESGGRLAAVVVIELDDAPLITQVVLFDLSTNRGALFDVPQETGVVVTSLNRIDSIDTVLAADGIDAFREEVSALVGEPVPFHLYFDGDDLEAIVDFVEGLPLFVTDLPNEGPDAVLIPNGDVVLDGAKTRAYLRYSGEGERGRERIARYQKVVVALLEELGNHHGELSSRDGIRLTASRITTNLDRGARSSLLSELETLENDRMITRQVEGIYRRVVTDEAEEVLLFPHQEGRWLRESVRQVVENLASEESIRDENIVIRLEILNGTDVTGLAARTAELFRSYGFDVVAVGNAQRDDVAETIVINRSGSEIFARRTADIIRAPRTESDSDGQAAVDVTVILGEDFDGRYVR